MFVCPSARKQFKFSYPINGSELQIWLYAIHRAFKMFPLCASNTVRSEPLRCLRIFMQYQKMVLQYLWPTNYYSLEKMVKSLSAHKNMHTHTRARTQANTHEEKYQQQFYPVITLLTHWQAERDIYILTFIVGSSSSELLTFISLHFVGLSWMKGMNWNLALCLVNKTALETKRRWSFIFFDFSLFGKVLSYQWLWLSIDKYMCTTSIYTTRPLFLFKQRSERIGLMAVHQQL